MLNIRLSTLIFQIINFLILVFLLTKFLFRPLMRLLAERSRSVTRALDEAERREREAEGMRDEYQGKVEEARQEAQAIREGAREEIETLRREVIEQARAEMQSMRARAEEEIEQERTEAIKRHREDIGSIVTSLSARMLTEVGNGRLHSLFFEAFLDRLAKLEPDSLRTSAAQQRRPARRYGEETGEIEVVPVEITSAHPLSGLDAERLQQTLSSLLDRGMRLELSVDPSLIGGAVVRFGDHLVDGSLRGQLARLRERFVEEMAER
jgi:F-type H+-transporting ATPase subunit b